MHAKHRDLISSLKSWSIDQGIQVSLTHERKLDEPRLVWNSRANYERI